MGAVSLKEQIQRLADIVSRLDTSITNLNSILSKLTEIKGDTGKLNVNLDTRASELTLSGIKSKTDSLALDASGRVRSVVESIPVTPGGWLTSIPNPPNLDTPLSGIKSRLDANLPYLDEYMTTLRDRIAEVRDKVADVRGQLDTKLTDVRDRIAEARDRLTDADGWSVAKRLRDGIQPFLGDNLFSNLWQRFRDHYPTFESPSEVIIDPTSFGTSGYTTWAYPFPSAIQTKYIFILGGHFSWTTTASLLYNHVARLVMGTYTGTLSSPNATSWSSKSLDKVVWLGHHLLIDRMCRSVYVPSGGNFGLSFEVIVPNGFTAYFSANVHFVIKGSPAEPVKVDGYVIKSIRVLPDKQIIDFEEENGKDRFQIELGLNETRSLEWLKDLISKRKAELGVT